MATEFRRAAACACVLPRYVGGINRTIKNRALLNGTHPVLDGRETRDINFAFPFRCQNVGVCFAVAHIGLSIVGERFFVTEVILHVRG
jgi:hypothetical protein